MVTLNSAITTEKKLINAVAKINGLEKLAGLLKTNVWKIYQHKTPSTISTENMTF